MNILSRFLLQTFVGFLAATQPSYANTNETFEYMAHGNSISVMINNCNYAENIDYANIKDATTYDLRTKSSLDLTRVSLWVIQPHEQSDALSRIRTYCEQDDDQCITIDQARAIKEEHSIRLSCDKMYVSCIRNDHMQQQFKLTSTLDIIHWIDNESERIGQQNQLRDKLFNSIESCKAEAKTPEPPFVEDIEGQLLKTLDATRVQLQDANLVFRNMSVQGPVFMPVTCGELKAPKNDAYRRLIHTPMLGLKVEEHLNDTEFSAKYWDEYCGKN